MFPHSEQSSSNDNSIGPTGPQVAWTEDDWQDFASVCELNLRPLGKSPDELETLHGLSVKVPGIVNRRR